MIRIDQLLQTAMKQTDRLDAEVLLAHILAEPREYFYAHPETWVSHWQVWRFRRLVHRRQHGVPLAYLTGHKEFFGLDFIVNRHTLIPRPETELMVEAVLKKLHPPSNTLPVMVDVGTGTGCIPIAIMKTRKQESPAVNGIPLRRDKKTKKQSNMGTVVALATDISRLALRVAKKNANRHQVNIQFFQGNLLDPILNNFKTYNLKPETSLIITANLPYLTRDQFSLEPSIQHEPISALVADAEAGLSLYDQFLRQLKKFVTCYMLRVTCYFEINPSQVDLMTKNIHTSFPKAVVTIHHDLAGRPRVVEFLITK